MAREAVAQEITSSANDRELWNLGKVYFDHILCGCMLLS